MVLEQGWKTLRVDDGSFEIPSASYPAMSRERIVDQNALWQWATRCWLRPTRQRLG